MKQTKSFAMELTFDNLPKAISILTEEVSLIKQLLLNKPLQQTETDCWFNITELCDYLPDKPAKTTVYGWVHIGIIPHHKGGKKLRFLKSEIDLWLKQGRVKTQSELANEANIYLKTNKQTCNTKRNKGI